MNLLIFFESKASLCGGAEAFCLYELTVKEKAVFTDCFSMSSILSFVISQTSYLSEKLYVIMILSL